MTKRRTQHACGPEFLKSLGDVTASFSLLETIMGRVAIDLLRAPKNRGEAILSLLSTKQIRAFLVSAAKHEMKSDHFAEFKRLVTRTSVAESRRNSIIHCTWAGDGTNMTRIKGRTTESKGFSTKYERTTKTDLDKIADEIKELISEYSDFMILLATGQKLSEMGGQKSPSNPAP